MIDETSKSVNALQSRIFSETEPWKGMLTQLIIKYYNLLIEKHENEMTFISFFLFLLHKF